MASYGVRIKPSKDYLIHADSKEEKSVGEILDTLNEEQRNVVNYLLYKALGFSGKEAKRRNDDE